MCEAQIYIKKHLKTEKITLIGRGGGVVSTPPSPPQLSLSRLGRQVSDIPTRPTTLPAGIVVLSILQYQPLPSYNTR